MKQNKQIDEHVSRLLKEHEARPALSSFDAVLARLQKKRRKRLLWIFFTGLGLSGSIFLAYYSVTAGKNISSEKTITVQYDRPTTGQPDVIALQKTIAETHAVNDQQASLKETLSKTGGEKNKAQSSVPGNARTSQIIPSPAALSATFEKQTAPVPGSEQLFNAIPEKNNPVNERQNIQNASADGIVYLNAVTPVFISASPEIDAYKPLALRPLLNDSLNKKGKRPYKLYLGISINPQIANYSVHKNPAFSSSAYNAYLRSKKEQAKFRFTYGFGLRFGLVYKDKWEFLAGFGYQQYNYYEKSPPFSTIGAIPLNTYPYNTNNPLIPGKDGFKTTLNYSSYNLDAAKIITFKSLIKIKAGAGLQVNRLFGTGFNTANASITVLTPHIKAGAIYDITKKLQLQLCPDLYYSAGSVLNKNNAVRQNSYGIGLEGSLLFKIR